MKRPLLLFTAVIACGAAGLYGSGFLLDRVAPAGSGANAREGRDRPVKVELAPTAKRQVREIAEAVGSTRAIQSIDLKPAADGRIVAVLFDAGQQVSQGQLLAQLDDRAEKATLKEAEATLAEARNNLERLTTLSQRNVSSDAVVEAAEAQLLRAEALREQAANTLADRRIIAPFAGTVGFNALDVGARVTTATVVTSLDDMARMEVRFSLPEAYFARVKAGQQVLARSDAYGERRFEGEVTAIDPRIDAASRAFQVRATLPNDDRALATGMFVGVELVVEQRDALTVPEVALINEGEKAFVFAAENGEARRREVRTGLRDNGNVEIREGLEPGSQVVASGLQRVRDGAGIEAEGVAQAKQASGGPLG